MPRSTIRVCKHLYGCCGFAPPNVQPGLQHACLLSARYVSRGAASLMIGLSSDSSPLLIVYITCLDASQLSHSIISMQLCLPSILFAVWFFFVTWTWHTLVAIASRLWLALGDQKVFFPLSIHSPQDSIIPLCQCKLKICRGLCFGVHWSYGTHLISILHGAADACEGGCHGISQLTRLQWQFHGRSDRGLFRMGLSRPTGPVRRWSPPL